MNIYDSASGNGYGSLWKLNAEKKYFSILWVNNKRSLPVESKNENESIPGQYFERAIAKLCETCILRKLPIGACLFRFLVGVVIKTCD